LLEDGEQWTVDSEQKRRGPGMKLKDQAMFANLAIFGGMVVAYFQGYNVFIIVGVGVVVFVIVSAIFLYRIRQAKKTVDSGQ
jgi:Ca2+-dependent lipid-binding protein